MHQHTTTEEPLNATISGLVLAGGKSRRFGGEDKGLLPLADKPMVEHVLERLAPQVQSLFLSCNRHQSDYQNTLNHVASAHPSISETALVSDPAPQNYAGPLVGIYSLLQQARTGWVLICPCDMPLIPRTIVRDLTETLRLETKLSSTSNNPLLAPNVQWPARRTDDKNEATQTPEPTTSSYDACHPAQPTQRHFLPVLINRTAGLQCIQQLPDYGQHASVRAWLERLRVCHRPYPDNYTGFQNINNPKQLKKIEFLLAKKQ